VIRNCVGGCTIARDNPLGVIVPIIIVIIVVDWCVLGMVMLELNSMASIIADSRVERRICIAALDLAVDVNQPFSTNHCCCCSMMVMMMTMLGWRADLVMIY